MMETLNIVEIFCESTHIYWNVEIDEKLELSDGKSAGVRMDWPYIVRYRIRTTAYKTGLGADGNVWKSAEAHFILRLEEYFN